MTTPFDTDSVPAGFDPVVFWLKHKTKIIIYGAILIIVAVGFAYYEISTQNALTDARLKLAQAGSEADYRQIVQKYPHTVAAGDASLLLAAKLRDEKKYDDAAAVLQAMIDGQPTHPMIDGAWLSLACTYNMEGGPKTDLALQTYKQIANKFADRYSAPQALYSAAEILKAQGKLDDAKIAYENVKNQFPDSDFASMAVQKLQLLKK